jgi:hypothetical protein
LNEHNQSAVSLCDKKGGVSRVYTSEEVLLV